MELFDGAAEDGRAMELFDGAAEDGRAPTEELACMRLRYFCSKGAGEDYEFHVIACSFFNPRLALSLIPE